MPQAVEGFRRQITQADQYTAVGLADDIAVHDVHIGNGAARELLGIFKDLVAQDIAGLRDGEAADIGLAGGIRAEAEGGDIRVLIGDDVYVAIVLQANDVRRHLCIGSVRALTDLRFAYLHLHRTVLIQNHTAGGMLKRDGPDSSVVPEGGDADALADRAGLLGIFRVLAVVVHIGHGLVKALVEAVKIVLVLGETVHIAHGHDVLAAPLEGVHAQHLADVLDVALMRPRSLRHTVAAHCTGDGLVGEHRVGVALEIRTGVELREGAHGLGHDAVAVGGVSALIGEQLDLARGKAAVRMQPRNKVDTDGVAHAVGNKGVLARDVDLDQTAAELLRQPCRQRLIEGVLLVAEAAADIGLDHADAAPGNPQCLTDGAADNVRDLRGGNDDDLARFLVSIDDMIFNMAVLHSRGIIPLVHADQPRLFDGFLIVADADVAVAEDVVREFLM